MTCPAPSPENRSSHSLAKRPPSTSSIPSSSAPCANRSRTGTPGPFATSPRSTSATLRRSGRGAVLTRTEAAARALSWGLMQVMGQVAREAGFAGASLAELCDPAAGLEVGCRVLAHKLAAAEGNVTRALLLWNGGGNPAYPQQVLDRAKKYR